MAFIPKDAQWYLADIVEHITVAGDKRSVVHTNMVLVRADSPEDAYEEAVKLGKEAELTYENSAGKRVECRFRGLHDLNVIHDELVHGAEIGYSKEIGMKESAIKAWVTPKRKLGIFRPIQKPSGPDYADGEIVRKVADAMHAKKKQRQKNE